MDEVDDLRKQLADMENYCYDLLQANIKHHIEIAYLTDKLSRLEGDYDYLRNRM